ncbi:SDR family NAD(P)-dependent oxidoreductase [Rudanella lutea]|uniref:SDR family NAD(P)-dependent oxidoreductase n=1 Tax=Rudanella lutea TaxID=451374 RepID=UPI00036E696C|nr:SDR family oxidoreductase [Rudanella lutea]
MALSSNKTALLWGLAGLGAVLASRAVMRQSRKIDFAGKHVIITGGSRGLGLVLARQLVAEGAHLSICARDPYELDRARTELEQQGGRVLTYECDLTNKEDIAAFVSAARAHLGPVDVLINNAGVIMVTPFANAAEEDYQDALATNFWAAYHMIQAVLPDMRQRRAGRIVNVASFGGKVAAPHLSPYVTSKFALVGFSESIRAELKRDGIFVTTICPGLIRTGSPRNAIVKGQHEKEYAWFKIGDSLPGLTTSAEDCASQIIDACRHGEAERVVTVMAKVGTALQGLSPSLMAETLTLINDLLPDPAPSLEGNQRAFGAGKETPISQSVLTTLTDQAAQKNNQTV